jgi:hypothetical protein
VIINSSHYSKNDARRETWDFVQEWNQNFSYFF